MPTDERSDPQDVYLTETDAAILADVVGHPYQLPTIPELLFMNRDAGEETVKRRLRRLIDRGLIERVTFSEGDAPESGPDTFFGATEFGRTVLGRRLPEDRERRLYAAYARVEKPAVIRRYERAPRPPR